MFLRHYSLIVVVGDPQLHAKLYALGKTPLPPYIKYVPGEDGREWGVEENGLGEESKGEEEER